MQPVTAVFDGRPWRALVQDDIEHVLHVPSMLAWEETKFYYWLAQTFATDDGAIVDLGSFIGGSTARLAGGVMAAGAKARVHAFDRFTVDEHIKEKLLYAQGVAPFEGRDMLPVSKALLEPFGDHVVHHPGDIEDSGWTGPKIDILTHDASKSRVSMDRQAEIFWPHLVAGRSIIVQQDFLHKIQPWVPVQMEIWADHFEPLAFVRGSSVAFLCTKVPSPDLLAIRRVANLPHDEQVQMLEASRRRLGSLAPKVKADLGAARDILKINPGVDAPWKMKRPQAA